MMSFSRIATWSLTEVFSLVPDGIAFTKVIIIHIRWLLDAGI